MGYNPTTRTFDLISDLKKQGGTSNVTITLNGYNAAFDGGEGSFYWDSTSTEPDNGGTIFQVTNAGVNANQIITTGRWKRIYRPNFINILWFGVDRTGVTPCTIQYEIAKLLIPTTGGTIYFPAGTYMSNNTAWRVYRNNLTLKGDGIDKTILTTPSTVGTALDMAPYRSAGWDFDPTHVFTFEDNLHIGQQYIDIKVGEGQADLALLTPGKCFFANFGSSYYDQQYGEFNIVDKVVGNRVYLQYALGRDYSTDRSSLYGSLAADFTVPPIGQTAVASFTADAALPIIQTNYISIGNELFQIAAVNGTNITLRNLGKGNTSTVIPAGTKISKYRAIILTPSTSINTVIEDLTFDGYRKACTFSNSIKTYCNRVKFYRKKSASGGSWIDGDDGRDLKLINCVCHSEDLRVGQMARSFGDVDFINCKFFQALTEVTEFNFNFRFDKCDFHAHANLLENPDDSTFSVLNLGTTTSNVKVTNCNFYIDTLNAAISATDIQVYGNASVTNILVEGNTFYLSNVSKAIDIYRSGTIRIINNTIVGQVVSIFGASGALSYGANNLLDQNGRGIYGSECVIKNNRVDAYCDYFINRGPTNLIVDGNEINRLGPYDKIAPSADSISAGNIIRNGSIPPNTIERIIFKNNTFRNWYYNARSLDISGLRNIRWDLSNNLFINAQGTIKNGMDFFHDEFTPNTLMYGSINYYSQIKNKDTDYFCYADLVRMNGGILSTTESNAVKQLLTDIYNNNLRTKIKFLYPFVGDTTAAKIALIGWEKNSYKPFESKGLTYTSASGWAGDNTRGAILGTSADLDISNIGVFIQVTAPPTANTPYHYFGRYGGGNSTSARIAQTSNSILNGIGGGAIVSSNYNPSNGFIYSGLAAGVQLNYIDSTNHKLNNTNIGTAQIVGSLNSFNLLGTDIAGMTGTFGCAGITELLTLLEAQTLRTIIYNFMVALGRPVQTTSITPIISNNYNYVGSLLVNETSLTVAQINKSFLNTNYPTAILKDRVVFTNVSDYSNGVIIADKLKNDNWLLTQSNSLAV